MPVATPPNRNDVEAWTRAFDHAYGAVESKSKGAHDAALAAFIGAKLEAHELRARLKEQGDSHRAQLRSLQTRLESFIEASNDREKQTDYALMQLRADLSGTPEEMRPTFDEYSR